MYTFFKILAKLALFFYTRKIVTNFDINTNFDQPKILASNHPNSFFDAIVIAIKYPKPIYFLARGDAFKNKLIAAFLKSIHLIPIYRLSEGKENLSKNDETFKICLELLKKNQTILIFSEGLCVNEWQLRPLKKGTARLALLALNENINNVLVQPVNINYSSFNNNPKEILINFNQEIEVTTIEKNSENNFYRNFKIKLKEGILDKMIVKNDSLDIQLFIKKSNHLKTIFLSIPAFIGFLTQYWLYIIFKTFALKKTINTVFYDSVLFGMLLIFYPIIVVLFAVIIGLLTNFYTGMLVFIALPITAYCYKEFKSNQ